MKKTGKFLSALLSILLVASAGSAAAFADDTEAPSEAPTEVVEEAAWDGSPPANGVISPFTTVYGNGGSANVSWVAPDIIYYSVTPDFADPWFFSGQVTIFRNGLPISTYPVYWEGVGSFQETITPPYPQKQVNYTAVLTGGGFRMSSGVHLLLVKGGCQSSWYRG